MRRVLKNTHIAGAEERIGKSGAARKQVHILNEQQPLIGDLIKTSMTEKKRDESPFTPGFYVSLTGFGFLPVAVPVPVDEIVSKRNEPAGNKINHDLFCVIGVHCFIIIATLLIIRGAKNNRLPCTTFLGRVAVLAGTLGDQLKFGSAVNCYTADSRLRKIITVHNSEKKIAADGQTSIKTICDHIHGAGF